MIAIVDYGMGNLCSVETALKKYTDDVVITDDPAVLTQSDKIVLPGVGAFRDAIAALKVRNLDSIIYDEVARGKPLLGICLGFQLLFEESFENGHFQGLGLMPGSVQPFSEHLSDASIKIPHMGWNQLSFTQDSPLCVGVEEGSHVYFVHSYFLQTSDASIVVATTQYGMSFPVAVAKEKIFGTQFHPEKSQKVGLQIIKNFVVLC